MVSLRVKEQDDQDGVSPEEAEESTIVPAENAAVRFRKSFQKCRQGLRSERWQAAIRTLETDSLFAEEAITDLLREPEWQSKAESLFSGLSSGHAIVLLTITRLVELVDERTLVLIDEPESHLHPPFLSAFIRSLSDLLVKRNGVAIIASHSPVVLQEVPKTCVWMLRRSGTSSVTERPPIETFGENVGILTREVYGLEVINSGFHKLLQDTVYKEGLSYERLLRHFGGQLGAEARAIAKGMIAERDDLSGNEQ
jgi:predicted ATPase